MTPRPSPRARERASAWSNRTHTGKDSESERAAHEEGQESGAASEGPHGLNLTVNILTVKNLTVKNPLARGSARDQLRGGGGGSRTGNGAEERELPQALAMTRKRESHLTH